MNCSKHKPIFILFGSEAIKLFSISPTMLFMEYHYIPHKAESFNNMNEFLTEKKRWDEFLVITKRDYCNIKANQKISLKFNHLSE